jgi:hypothetical protein
MSKSGFNPAEYKTAQQKIAVVHGSPGVHTARVISDALSTENGLESGLQLQIPYTTRKPAAGELHGVHYNFIKPDEFESYLDVGLLLESARLEGVRYGLPTPELAFGGSNKPATLLYKVGPFLAESIPRVRPIVRIALYGGTPSLLEHPASDLTIDNINADYPNALESLVRAATTGRTQPRGDHLRVIGDQS